MENKIWKEVDLRGEVCPETSIQTKQALARIKGGEAIKLLVDYAPAVESIHRLARNEGHEVLKLKKSSEHWEIILRKGES